MNREVNVTKRVQTSKGMRYCSVVLSANGRIKPDAVLVNGKPERHTEGAYYLEWREGRKRVRLSVNRDAADASARRMTTFAQRSVKRVGRYSYGAKQGIPSVLVIYNNLDPIHLFGTEDQDFISAMYGAYTVLLDRESMKAVDYFNGRNRSLGEAKNTSFSAVGRLYPVRGKLEVTLFENVFAKVNGAVEIANCARDC